MCLLALFRQMGDGEGLLELHVSFLEGRSWELQMPKEGGDHRKNKSFINNFVEALIPFNEEHPCLLRLHVPLG